MYYSKIGVTAALPQKQGLKLRHSITTQARVPVTAALPQKQGLKLAKKDTKKIIEQGHSGTSTKTRIETILGRDDTMKNDTSQRHFHKNKD